MTRIVSYNILAGGYSLRENGNKRTTEIVKIIRSAQPDVVGLVEATNSHITSRPLVIEEIAEQLGMQLILGGDPEDHEFQVACLTRLPVVYTKLHRIKGKFARTMLEVCVEEQDGQQFTLFVVHLSAAFYYGWAGTKLREGEVRELLRITKFHREQGLPHAIVGDFNSLAPHDPFKASFLLKYIVRMDQSRHIDEQIADGHPHLNFIVPPHMRFLNPILRTIPQSKLLCDLFDLAASLYAPRKPIHMLLQSGYVDCYRQSNAHSWGFTCPAAAPAGRIDFIFAHSVVAERLEDCHEIVQGEDGIGGDHASDHLALTAEFGTKVQVTLKPSAAYDMAVL